MNVFVSNKYIFIFFFKVHMLIQKIKFGKNHFCHNNQSDI